MAKFRYVNTAIWDDEWFVDLDPIEQHLFIYLLTNAYTNIAGIYQLSLRRMAFETGIDQEKVKKILARFEAEGKVFSHLGWMIMKNWHKHQSLNPNQAMAVVNFVNAMPEPVRLMVLSSQSPSFIPFESLTKGMVSLGNDSLSVRYNPNPNSNPNPNPKGVQGGRKPAAPKHQGPGAGYEDIPS